ncbi:MAG TPA: tyrosine-type recombinase/integrase [Candidatus Acidoferrum sp.]|nr:tyrosine-type recombinase/integrase [Candidatus Acidoferrum sp.]
MGISKYTLYKYVKVDGTWRYCKAAFHENGKIKPDIVFVNVKQALLEKHPEGRYYMSHNGTWIDAGADALEAQRKRKQRLALDEFTRLSGKGGAQASALLPDSPGRITLAAAAEKYFENCEARGLDSETIRKYRAAVDPFVEHCGVTYVDECRDNKQVLLKYMGWLRKQPVPQRKHSNPERTLANKVGDVRIFLKEFGISKLLKKNEEPKYHEKKVVAHPDDELDVLYGAADADETFLLDFFIGSMARDHEAHGKYGDPDLTGTTLTLYGKHHKTRTVEITERLAAGIRNRRKRNKYTRLFVNRNGKPDKHLLRELQNVAKKAGAKFHTELHKLRKTGASRRYLANVPLPTLMLELGHESLAVTQDYLADVRKPGEAKKAVADADFIPKPNVVKTGTDGD